MIKKISHNIYAHTTDIDIDIEISVNQSQILDKTSALAVVKEIDDKNNADFRYSSIKFTLKHELRLSNMFSI